MKQKTHAEMEIKLIEGVKKHPTNLQAVFKMVAYQTGHAKSTVQGHYYRKVRPHVPMFMTVTPNGVAINQKCNQVKVGGKRKLELTTEVVSMKDMTPLEKQAFVDLIFNG